MFRKMLVCTDLSPASDALIQCAEELKRIGLEEVILTHISLMITAPGVEEILTEKSSPILQQQKRFLEKRGLRVTVEIPSGLPATALAETAEEHDVSAILIGSHGKGILQATMLGSVSSELLSQTRRPVLLARIALLDEGKCKTVCAKMFTKVLFPTDFSENAERALDYLGKITQETGCPVTVMHVRDKKRSGHPDTGLEEEDARFLLKAKAERLSSRGATNIEGELVQGEPGEEIVKRAGKGDISIIVMGTQGKGIIRELFMGSVAKNVARLAETPVLFIPAAKP